MFEEFFKAYVESALWTGMHQLHEDKPDETQNLEDYSVDDLEPETRRDMREDCEDFWEAHSDILSADPTLAGYDFNLSRNGHGAGFFDGDWPHLIGDELHRAAKVYGTFQLVLYGEFDCENNLISYHS